jgi:7-carboxy-7-deazaguanine synthase
MGIITLSEKLHPVIQGEGELIGRKMILMRVHGCPIQCPACDSYHTWDKTRLSDYRKEYTPQELAEELNSELMNFGIDTVLITGGEPQIYRDQIKDLIETLQHIFPTEVYFDIETTGSVSWSEEITNNENVHFDLSPKIGSLGSGVNIKNWKLFEDLPNWYNLKVVVSEENFEKDLDSIQEFIERYNIPKNKVYLMPLGTTREEMVKSSGLIVDTAIRLGYEFSPRLHIFIFSNARLK